MPDAHNASSAFYACGALPYGFDGNHSVHMSKKGPKPPTYFAAWRKEKGLTQEQLAERLEVSQEQISRLETGRNEFTLSMIHAWADALGIDPEAFWRPPKAPKNELAEIARRLDAKKRAQAVRVVRAMLDEETAA